MSSKETLRDLRVNYAGRVYRLDRAQWPNGAAALLLINVQTQRCLPVALPGTRMAKHPNEAFIVENDGILKTLLDAGLVKATDEVTKWQSLTLRACELVHPELIWGAEQATAPQNTTSCAKTIERDDDLER